MSNYMNKIPDVPRKCDTVNFVDDPDLKLLILIALVVSLAGAAWFFRDMLPFHSDELVILQIEPPVEEIPVQSGPSHPIESTPLTEAPDVELVALPALDDSDGYFVLALVDMFGTEIEDVLVNAALIDKFVATVDNLTRSHVAEQIRPVGRLPDAFVVGATDEEEQFLLSPDNYERYDALVNLVAGADVEVIAATYRRFYPLFQKSYERLGYPNAYFNDRVVEVIDLLLTTPEPVEPIRLVRPHVLYEFADSEVESLASGQKVLIRMGGERSVRIKLVLQDLRALIVQEESDQ
jgi:hypothetical protein